MEHTNKRKDQWGGPYANRIRFPVEIVRSVREAVGPDFIIIFRLSMLDLVEKGSTWEEIVELAKKIEDAGATIINTGIGWHEARIPTIATSVPRGGFSWVTKKLMGEVGIPLITTNRINAPDVGDRIIADGHAGKDAAVRLMALFIANLCVFSNLSTVRHGVNGASVLGRPGARAEGEGRPRRRDQHVHWMQPGVLGPHL